MRIPNPLVIKLLRDCPISYQDIPKGYQRVFFHKGKKCASHEKRVRPRLTAFGNCQLQETSVGYKGYSPPA